MVLMEPKYHDKPTGESAAPKSNLDLGVENTAESEGRTEYRILTLDNYRKVAEEEQSMVPLQYADDESLRAHYVNRTEDLIGEILQKDIDTVVFLDKSARPLSWMVREFWDIFAPGKPMPEMKFVNIDAAQWANMPSDGARPTEEDMAEVVVTQDEIQKLRTIFTPKEAVWHEGDESTLGLADHTYLDGRRVLVVDEIKTTGSTLKFASQVMQQAFPEATDIQATSWMTATFIKKGQGLYPREIPVWYHHEVEAGRGVGDAPDREWLSRRFDTPDEDSLQLRAEFRQLAKDVRDGKQPIIPAGDLDDPRYAGMKIRQVR